MSLRTVAALYVDPKGQYVSMPGVDCWDEKRDAMTYWGPHPIVAHPPCGPWGALYKFCTKQNPACGPIAVAQVRKFGGVLEHPRGSKLWAHCQLPKPNEVQDKFGGFTVEIKQCHYGHKGEKLTWLYICGVTKITTIAELTAAANYNATPTHIVSSLGANKSRGPRLPEMTKRERFLTPKPLAEVLVKLARLTNEN